jgi:hypothetical protein
VAAELLASIDPAASRAFARRGHGQTFPAGFANDCRTLLHGKSPATGILRGALRNLRDLPEQDLDALAAMLDPGGAAFLRKAHATIRGADDAALERALPELERLERLIRGER